MYSKQPIFFVEMGCAIVVSFLILPKNSIDIIY